MAIRLGTSSNQVKLINICRLPSGRGRVSAAKASGSVSTGHAFDKAHITGTIFM